MLAPLRKNWLTESMALTENDREFIDHVKVNVVSWLAISCVAGIGYLVYTVPSRLAVIERIERSITRYDIILDKHDERIAETEREISNIKTILEVRP